MVEADGVDGVEACEIIGIRGVVAVPGDDVERRVIELGSPQPTLEFRDDLPVSSLSSKAATGVRKSRGLARPLEPMGPSSGRRNRRRDFRRHSREPSSPQLDAEPDRRAERRQSHRGELEHAQLGGQQKAT